MNARLIEQPPLDLGIVDRIVGEHGGGPEAVIPILHGIQSAYHWLPPEALARVCKLTRITPAQIEGVSTFYAHFRHEPAGEYVVKVCHGTACHVKGADLVEDGLRRYANIPAGEHTSADGKYTIERVGCIGCCNLAPVIGLADVTYGHRTPGNVPSAIEDYLRTRVATPEQAGRAVAKATARAAEPTIELRVGCGSCCVAGGADRVRAALERVAEQSGGRAVVTPVGCVGMCHQTPMVEVSVNSQKVGLYNKVDAPLATRLARKYARPASILGRIRNRIGDWFDTLAGDTDSEDAGGPADPGRRHLLDARDPAVCAFLGPQLRIATEHCGEMDPLDLDAYLAVGGFEAAKQALAEADPARVIETIKASGLRGRGGAGFPTGVKWERARASAGELKYVIVNGDEGDPGAFMDRMILESFPYRVIEGLIVASWAVGAREGIFYVRHEYPLAVRRIKAAIARCEARGILGERVLGSEHSLKLRLVEGAGAFVCGEETAMIASIQGERGMPRLRPPFPAVKGLWGRPTCINNVETYALVPWIVRNGAEAFAAIGTATSKGTKVFSLTGKIRRGGLVEVPMGTTIRQIVEEIGGGVAAGRRSKAVQIGGPSGGCIPASLADLPVDYESLRDAGAIVGSGGLVVLDDTDCMVDMARYFLQFAQAESCGKCTLCRVGTKVMLGILEKLCAGKATAADLAKLEDLCGEVRQGSLCGLGQTAPNPVLTTLRYFRDEYEAHVKGRCPAGQCKGLIKYVVNDRCIGCTRCAQNCPAGAIPMAPYRKHAIDVAKCTRCDVCRGVCPERAIDVV